MPTIGPVGSAFYDRCKTRRHSKSKRGLAALSVGRQGGEVGLRPRQLAALPPHDTGGHVGLPLR